jgi:RNA polymerase sigma factor (TIGR02999 family)
MRDVTEILNAMGAGDSASAADLMPMVYEELRRLAASKMAREAPGQTLQATALVHEAWVRLSDGKDQQWNGRGHFFAAAAEAMRRILVENARRRNALKRGGELDRTEFDEMEIVGDSNDDELLMVNEALDELGQEEPVIAELVKLRFFAGLKVEEAALALNISKSTAIRHWSYARAWLFDAISDSEE